MKRKILLAVLYLSCLLFISHFSFSQNPLLKQWDYRFGGTGQEYLYSIQQTSDGGYILGGFSASGIGGDKTQAMWGEQDYWIVKTDSLGNKQWDKDFGGTSSDFLMALQQTVDGGYILGGYSWSGTGGDKTQAGWGGWDYWIIKTDSLGSKLWDKDFGGTDDDELTSIQQTSDGGYILGGYSWSGIGGDKSQSNWNWNSPDYWIVKIDSLGIKQWDKRFGGTGEDELTSLQQTSDGGYILGGYSKSGSVGDKSWPTKGLKDYWIIKIDSLGIKQWDKDFGGTDFDWLYSLKQTRDKGYILGGNSKSGISGDKTEALWGNVYDYDYWIIKTDSLGNKEWDKDFGGTNAEDEFGNISQTFDGGYLFAGTSYSNISGNKTENNLGSEQTWIIKTDSLGIKQWDKTLQTASPVNDEYGLVIQTKDGCYVMANYTASGAGGDKTHPNQDTVDITFDYWFIKFCDTTTILPFLTNDPTICEKFCISFTDQSTNNPTSWQWNFPGGDPSSSTDQNPTNICYDVPGTYDVTLMTSNANGSDTLTLHNYITVYPTPPIPTITQNGNTLTSSPAEFYQWQLDAVDIPGATNQSYEVLQTGFYTVVVSDSNGCKNSTTLYVDYNGIDEISDAGISVYPNPSNGNFIIQWTNDLPGKEVSIDVVNALNQKIYSSSQFISSSNPKMEIHLSEHAEGLYFIRLKCENTFDIKKILVVF